MITLLNRQWKNFEDLVSVWCIYDRKLAYFWTILYIFVLWWDSVCC